MVNPLDAATWQALGLLLTVLGLLLSIVLWRRRGPASGIRGAAWSLLPLAAGLTGTLRLLWQIGDSILSWAVRLVFSPLVWVGIATFAVSLMLFAVSAAMRARGVGGRPGRGGAVEDGTGRGGRRGRESLPGTASRGRAEPAVQDKDMDDIEAILRKHGIS
jgi:hypothetical protein